MRSGDLPAIKLGGREQRRVERAELELYVQQLWADDGALRPRTPVAGDRSTQDDDAAANGDL